MAAPNTTGTAPAPAAGAPVSQSGGAGQQDALDKGVDSILNKAGHGQNRGTTEKISDGIRNVFKKVTGKDLPVKDKQ